MAYKVFSAPTGSGNIVFEGDVLNGYTSPDGTKVVLKFYSNDRGYTCGSYNTNFDGAKSLRDELVELLDKNVATTTKFSVKSSKGHFSLTREMDNTPLILAAIGTDRMFGTSFHRGDAEAMKKIVAEFDVVLKTLEDARAGKLSAV